MDKYHPYREDKWRLFTGPGYYAAPEGKDPIGKLWGLNRYALTAGLLLGTADVTLYSQTQGVAQTMKGLGYYIIPFMGIASSFVVGTFAATNIRNKDDKWNYTCGVIATLPVLYAWKKNANSMWTNAFFLLIAALLKKDSIQNDYELFPDGFNYEYGNYKYDMSLIGKTTEWPRRPF